MTLKRAISVSDFSSFNPTLLPFNEPWSRFMGCPELKGTWLIWGESGQGKTRFALQLAKYLAQFTRVGYNSLEEGLSASLKQAIEETDFSNVKRRVVFYDQEPLSDMIKRVQKPKGPQIWLLDSVQYTGMNYNDYRKLRPLFNTRQLILISHADGKHPAGRTAKSIKYDAFVKIRVEGYRAFAMSRYGGGAPMDIWPEGAKEYWGDTLTKNEPEPKPEFLEP